MQDVKFVDGRCREEISLVSTGERASRCQDRTAQNRAPAIHGRRAVVVCAVRHRASLCFLKQSHLVGSEQGQWQLVTDCLPDQKDPLQHALNELKEETGIKPNQVGLIRQCMLHYSSGWDAHAFLIEAASDHITLNWEHIDVKWVPEDESDASCSVEWTKRVWEVLRPPVM